MRGFTLIELMVAVGIIAILAGTGAAIFSRSLRGTSQIEIRRTLDDRSRLITSGLGRFFREGVAISLDGQSRNACLTAGSLNGDSLVIEAIDELLSTISESGGQISSVSAETVVINPEGVTVIHKPGLGYYFSWYCSLGVPDRLVMQFNATSTSQQGDSIVNNDYIIEVTMRNSGQ
ncbi:hypothetical protein A3A84_02295 [Candidatus Collierbacteria bacterium RIFCSPLOWO2_01_FULL_50_23]|uniref:Prepilin-type N-terminal cleavage/methylation domain-containing protein n=1 Tax=Candidatus Collierbacteria bacterium RIFCSPHIGHO2_01_FULL_50_25 TaxID=1817722 RepID=A0A1F5EUW3_9BACT|nr:MAG: hypothetical protein A2703_02340 [Candidatus Collierbacteria bacterium RIFCSPHIGHO2_01_FULL_50_25]OGD73789.1 MAG: hypothetical protein A3A84_02295 [Candidatus Collierbacteria bacterium RIFCSPLOWO2_01_FULL_50_23]